MCEEFSIIFILRYSRGDITVNFYKEEFQRVRREKKIQRCGQEGGEGAGRGRAKLLWLGEQESPSKRRYFN